MQIGVFRFPLQAVWLGLPVQKQKDADTDFLNTTAAGNEKRKPHFPARVIHAGADAVRIVTFGDANAKHPQVPAGADIIFGLGGDGLGACCENVCARRSSIT